MIDLRTPLLCSKPCASLAGANGGQIAQIPRARFARRRL
jgi:hypothetical protein